MQAHSLSLLRFTSRPLLILMQHHLSMLNAPCRKEVWADLLAFNSHNSLPWFVGGDFHVVSLASEKQGLETIVLLG